MIKKILILIILNFLNSSTANASEVFGNISTNLQNQGNVISEPAPIIINKSLAGGVPLLNGEENPKNILPKPKDVLDKKNNPAKEGEKAEKILVLGESHFADGALVRSKDKKIYLLFGDRKKLIRNLLELRKYRGQAIFAISFEDLYRYKTRNYLDGELIREKGRPEIYAVVKGKRRHIESMEKLRKEYAGTVVNNLSSEEMAIYKE